MDKEELLKKWLKGTLNEAERSAFEADEDYELHKEIVEGATHFKASNFSQAGSYEAFKVSMGALDKLKPVKKLYSYRNFLRIAAMLVIALGVYFTFFTDSQTEIVTRIAEQQTVLLPDASLATLNAGSKLVYNKKDWKGNRLVNLEGEAYFKVAKGSKFDVVTSDGVVSVLGTEFTVKQRKNYFEVSCFEGLVSVTTAKETHKLAQGKTFRVLNGIAQLEMMSQKNPEWLDNITNFKSVPLYEVINEFERQYNVNVKFENINTDSIITGGFVHTNMEEAIEAIIAPLELNYRKQNKNTIILYKKKQ